MRYAQEVYSRCRHQKIHGKPLTSKKSPEDLDDVKHHPLYQSILDGLWGTKRKDWISWGQASDARVTINKSYFFGSELKIQSFHLIPAVLFFFTQLTLFKEEAISNLKTTHSDF